jgi:hypothetical protein
MDMRKRNAGGFRLLALLALLALGLAAPAAAQGAGAAVEHGLTAPLAGIDAEHRVLRAEGYTFVVPAGMKQVNFSKLSPGQTVRLWWRGEGKGPFELSDFEVVSELD